MNKNDFVWCVGYSGNVAVVNKRARSTYGKLDETELLEKGLLRPAFCTALWALEIDKDENRMNVFLQGLSGKIGGKLAIDDAKRMLGVYKVPEGNVRTLSV